MNVIRRITLLLVTSSAILMLAGCASDGAMPDQSTVANAQEDIGQLHAAFMKAFNAKDASAMAATYTDDAILMPPNMPEVKTAVGIETYAHQMFANAPAGSGILLNVTDTTVQSGGWAFCSGFYTLLGANGTAADRGKFLEVLKQTDKGWKIHRDSFNSDMPVPSMAPAAGTAMAPAAATH